MDVQIVWMEGEAVQDVTILGGGTAEEAPDEGVDVARLETVDEQPPVEGLVGHDARDWPRRGQHGAARVQSTLQQVHQVRRPLCHQWCTNVMR